MSAPGEHGWIVRKLRKNGIFIRVLREEACNASF